MISHRTTATEYLNAGAVNSVIGLHSFYDDQVFFTVCFRQACEGPDFLQKE